MTKMLNLMVACAENRVMGRKNRLPWRIPEDLKVFHDETAGKTIILGRICYQTWPRAREDGRRLIVISCDRSLAREGVQVAGSVSEALAIAETMTGEIYVNGGERIFEEVLALDRPMRLHLTLVHAEVEGDRYFPEWRHRTWREISRRESADENFRYTFFVLESLIAPFKKNGQAARVGLGHPHIFLSLGRARQPCSAADSGRMIAEPVIRRPARPRPDIRISGAPTHWPPPGTGRRSPRHRARWPPSRSGIHRLWCRRE